MKQPINDGPHRRDTIFPDRGTYEHYSETTSGWTVTTNPKAAPDRRWKIIHKQYGVRFFREHDDIMKFTVEHMREQYYKTHPRR